MKNLFFILLLSTGSALAQLDPAEISIPMRDGEELAADLYLPSQSGQYPVILIQTPYNKNNHQNLGLPAGIGMDLENSPFAFVIMDWRCFWGSTNACTADFNRGEDGYDAVEWIAEQEWCNGKIGTWGPSALGNIQFDTANQQPPHLVCGVPKVSSPYTRYSTYLPGGALRTEFIQTLSSYYGSTGFDLMINNPYYNLIWTIAENTGFDPANIEVPMLLVAGWYDHNTRENFELIDLLSNEGDPAVADQHKIIIGPWIHGGTGQANVGSSEQGELEYPEAAEFDNEMERMFYDHYLLEIDNDWESTARYNYFTMGTNVWKSSDTWPSDEAELSSLFLHEDLSLQFTGATEEAELSYEYDPQDPSPTIGGKTLSFGLEQGPYDQRFEVENRDDILVFSSATLGVDLEVEGRIKVVCLVSTDQLDTDFCFRLTDVYPDGRSMLLGEAVQRLRFRDGYAASDEQFATAGERYEIEVEFDQLNIAFLSGHKIRLDITSSNYPRFNRNMNTGGEMYPNTNSDTLVNPLIASNSIHIGNAVTASRIELPVVNTTHIAQKERKELEIYPNPASSELRLNNENAGILKLYSATGKLCLTESISPFDIIQIEELNSGLYLLEFKEKSGQIYNAQLIKE